MFGHASTVRGNVGCKHPPQSAALRPGGFAHPEVPRMVGRARGHLATMRGTTSHATGTSSPRFLHLPTCRPSASPFLGCMLLPSRLMVCVWLVPVLAVFSCLPSTCLAPLLRYQSSVPWSSSVNLPRQACGEEDSRQIFTGEFWEASGTIDGNTNRENTKNSSR